MFLEIKQIGFSTTNTKTAQVTSPAPLCFPWTNRRPAYQFSTQHHMDDCGKHGSDLIYKNNAVTFIDLKTHISLLVHNEYMSSLLTCFERHDNDLSSDLPLSINSNYPLLRTYYISGLTINFLRQQMRDCDFHITYKNKKKNCCRKFEMICTTISEWLRGASDSDIIFVFF